MKKTKGFSLMELIVALGIAVLFFTAIVPLLMRATGTLKEMYQMKKAYVLAENEMEYLTSLDSARIENGTRGFTAVPKSDLSDLWKAKGIVSIADYPQAKGLKIIRVSLRWIAGKNRIRRVSLTTLKK